MKLSFFGENKKFRRKNMKKYFALLLAVMLVFSCALPTISADDVQNDTEITESTASEPQVLADPLFRTHPTKLLRTRKQGIRRSAGADLYRHRQCRLLPLP